MYHKIIGMRRHNLLAMIEEIEEFDNYLFSIKQEKYEKIGPHAFPIIVKEGAPLPGMNWLDIMKRTVSIREIYLRPCLPSVQDLLI